MSDAYEVCEGFKIYTDDSSESPREWDNIGTMICFHRDYRLGDKHDYKEAADAVMSIYSDLYSREKLCKFLKVEEGISDDWLIVHVRDRLEDLMEKIGNKAVVLPLYLYDHGGITMKTSPFSCPWDSGQVGFIYVPFDNIKKEYGTGRGTRTKARKYLQGEVETYDQYLTGEIYGYILDDKYGGDSCWGFYGLEAVKEAALDAINCTKIGEAESTSSGLSGIAGMQPNTAH